MGSRWKGKEKKKGRKEKRKKALFHKAAVWRSHLPQSRFILIQNVTALARVAGMGVSVQPRPG